MSKTNINPEADARWRAAAEKTIRRLTLERALDAAGVVGEDKELVADRMSRYVTLAEDGGEIVATVVDEAGEPRLGSRSLPVSVDALALEFREKYPRNFAKPEPKAPTGSTAAPAGSKWTGPNPFAAGSRSLTDQGKLFRTDPALYSRWKAESEGLPAPTAPSGPAPILGAPMRYFRPGSPDWSLTRQGEIFRADRALHDRLKAASEAV
ncbi:hypothetical protein [Methylobacterium sp. WL7]|uniref:hypothetical protein n=1 Tax=Methylobacterium sp. WL7 TaxID=2603900 RepID=UPI0011CA739E|nr:hypothetical protein [Methylobacterium sp. WL7]TXN43865.1 hypothetical protein FV233_16810 [Methylobacterium sp. WL7]